MQRFILNLRQLEHPTSEVNSDAQHFSRFSVSFGVPSDFLGNIGEPLDHGPSEPIRDDDDEVFCATEDLNDGLEENSAAQAGPSTVHWDDPTWASATSSSESTERAMEGYDSGLSSSSRQTSHCDGVIPFGLNV